MCIYQQIVGCADNETVDYNDTINSKFVNGTNEWIRKGAMLPPVRSLTNGHYVGHFSNEILELRFDIRRHFEFDIPLGEPKPKFDF